MVPDDLGDRMSAAEWVTQAWHTSACADLLAFFHDRLKVYLRDQGARHDLIDAVLSVGQSPTTTSCMIVRRVEALTSFIATEDGKNLLAGTKRATTFWRPRKRRARRSPRPSIRRSSTRRTNRRSMPR